MVLKRPYGVYLSAKLVFKIKGFVDKTKLTIEHYQLQIGGTAVATLPFQNRYTGTTTVSITTISITTISITTLIPTALSVTVNTMQHSA
jgi:hypothetical protein